MLGDLNKQSFVLDPELKKKKEEKRLKKMAKDVKEDQVPLADNEDTTIDSDS